MTLQEIKDAIASIRESDKKLSNSITAMSGKQQAGMAIEGVLEGSVRLGVLLGLRLVKEETPQEVFDYLASIDFLK